MSDVLLESPQGLCTVTRNAFTPEACAAWIQRTEALGYRPTGARYPASYRDNDRLVFDDPQLAATLFARMRAQLPEAVERDGRRWRLVGLNERFRCCRYRGGQRFAIHRDGAYVRSPTVRSLLTFMVYLNDAAEFTGGATRYFASRDASAPPVAVVRPEVGALVVFGHDVWHEGEAVHTGTKYVLRSDVLYELDDAAPGAEPLSGGAAGEKPQEGHTGYVWQAVDLGDGRVASGARDGTVRVWRVRGGGLACEQVIPAGSGSVTSLLAQAGTLWGGTREGTLRRWRVAEGLRPLSPVPGDAAVLCLAALPGGRVAVGDGAGRIQLRDADGGLDRVLRGHSGWVWSLLPDDGALLSAGEDGTVRRWRGGAVEVVQRCASPARALARTQDGVLVGTAAGEVLRLGSDAPLARHAGAVRALAALPGGRFASGGEDDRVRVWTAAGEPLAEHRHGDFVTSLLPLADGRLLSTSYDATLRVWGR